MKSDIVIHFEERKIGGRKVTDLKFIAEKKGDPHLVEQVENILMNPLIDLPDPAAPDAELLSCMQRFVVASTAKKLIKKYEQPALCNALDFCEGAFKARGDKIHNPVAFLKKAIEEEWILPEVMQLRMAQGVNALHEMRAVVPYPEEDPLLQEMRDALMERIGAATYHSWFSRVGFDIADACTAQVRSTWNGSNAITRLTCVQLWISLYPVARLSLKR